MHKTLMSFYPNELGSSPRQALDLIYYANPNTGDIVVQSVLYPKVSQSKIADQEFFITNNVNTLDLNQKLQIKSMVEFSLSFAALQRDTQTGKRVSIKTESEILAKVSRILDSVGLLTKKLKVEDQYSIQSGRRLISYTNAEVIGKGLITNKELLAKALIRGVGSNRLWGSGLLLVNPQ